MLTNDEKYGNISISTVCADGGVSMAAALTLKKELIQDEVSDRIIDIAERFAKQDGAHTITVRKILNELGTTNRVFYNRFRNIDDVLEAVYTKAVYRMQKTIKSDIDPRKDFFGFAMDIGVKVLTATYDIKMQFSNYMFEHDSLTDMNRMWWTEQIKKIVKLGNDVGALKDVDSDMLSYTIWCFLRGYNADAVGRRLPKEEAIKNFKFGFGYLIEGLKK